LHQVARALCALNISVIAMTAGAAANPLAASAFSYDDRAPLDVRITQRTIVSGVVRQDLTFAAPNGGRVHAEMIAPQKNGTTHAGVLFVHWLGDPQTTNLTEFEPDARALAQRGVTSLLIDAMWAQPHWFMRVRSTDTDYRDSIAQVVNLRRALDVLEAQPGVDAHRLAYVGHDFGAMYGAVLSGVDPRPRWFVLMAGNPLFSQWYLLGKKPADVHAYTAQMAALDPGPYLARSKAEAFLFQFSQKDEYISPNNQLRFFASAPLPKALYLYDADHSLRVPQAISDRLSWLLARLATSP
jgi:cephalosporin-C deacetylase-like acetyl esterase